MAMTPTIASTPSWRGPTKRADTMAGRPGTGRFSDDRFPGGGGGGLLDISYDYSSDAASFRLVGKYSFGKSELNTRQVLVAGS